MSGRLCIENELKRRRERRRFRGAGERSLDRMVRDDERLVWISRRVDKDNI